MMLNQGATCFGMFEVILFVVTLKLKATSESSKYFWNHNSTFYHYSSLSASYICTFPEQLCAAKICIGHARQIEPPLE